MGENGSESGSEDGSGGGSGSEGDVVSTGWEWE